MRRTNTAPSKTYPSAVESTYRMASSTAADINADPYPLNRDSNASARLHLQHYFWVSSLGYHLHPDIPLEENIRVADIGCGTGIWALEMARHLPYGGQIAAYDLNLAQCPPKEWWPENVSFAKLDIFQPLPKHLIAAYDVVQIRHLVCVVAGGDPMTLLSPLMKLLKPGGYLQWQEYDLSTNRLSVADSAASAPKMQAVMDMGWQISWVTNLHERFGEAGAELVVHDRRMPREDLRMVRQDIDFLVVREYAENLRARDPQSEQAAKLERLSNEANDECWRMGRGSVIECELVTWVARKT